MSNSNDVSRIHSKYSVTLLAPSSRLRSFIYSLIAAVVLAAILLFGLGQQTELLSGIVAVFAVLVATQALDSRLIRNRDYSKAIHLSLYVCVLWSVVSLAALAAAAILPEPGEYATRVGVGLFITASFRIGLLTTVLGASVKRAWAVCLIQPASIFLVLVQPEEWLPVLSDPVLLGFGGAFMVMATVWSVLTDRAGRPTLDSTHSLMQAYLYSREDMGRIESIFEKHSKVSKISTVQLKLEARGGMRDVRVVLPDVHPGPFHPVGGSNIPFMIYRTLGSSAMVMHSISDHALNLPSGKQVERYLQNLSNSSPTVAGASCTEPVTVQINRGRVLGIRFGKSALLFLSLSPHGTEDLPSSIKIEIEEYAVNRNFERVMIVDCHNAMGTEISGDDSMDVLKAARSCLDALMIKRDYKFEFGYANSSAMNIGAVDLAMGGLGMLCLALDGRRYFIGWADSNNMENGVREFVVERLARVGYDLLEISTSDTHFSRSTVRTKQGYYQFGAVTPREKIADWYLELAKRASEALNSGVFKILENRVDLRVMGPQVFENFGSAIENSLHLSKMFMAAGVALFLVSLLLLR